MPYNLGSEKKIKQILNNKQSYDSFLSLYDTYINIVDFHDKEKRFYGIKNKDGFEIVPKASKILFDDELEFIALDFVVFAYKQLIEKFFSLVRNGQIQQSPISKMLAKPYMSQIGFNFQPIVDENKVLFNNYISTNAELNATTSNIKDYVNSYISNIPQFKHSIQTHMKYYASYGLRNVSGLTVTLVNQPFNNDQLKVNFMSDVNFPVLRKLAEQYGFYIDKNIPWQITANISHPNIRSIIKNIYPQEKEITNDFIINTYFDVLFFIDYEKQKEFLYNAYVDLYEFRDTYTEAYYCGKKEKTNLNRFSRELPPKTLEDFLKFDEVFFLLSYLKMLNAENSFKYDLIEMQKFSKQVQTIYKKDLDKKKTLLYIVGKFYKKAP